MAMVALLILIAQSFVQKLAISEAISFLKFIDEIVVLYCIPYAIRVGLILFSKNRVFKGFFSLITIYWLFSIISSLFGEGTISQALYQFALDSKYIIIFLYCYGAYRVNISEEYLAKFFKFFVLLNIPFVLLQLFIPSFYNAIFPTGAHTGAFFAEDGGTFMRAAGIFFATGLFAFFAALASSFFLIKIWKGNKSNSTFLFLILSLSILLSTLSRGEVSAFLLSSLVTYLFFISNKKIRHINSVFIFALITSIILNNTSFIERGLVEMGIMETAVGITQSPRAIMMSSGLIEAFENFPLGAGLGTLGGQAAVVYDSNLFYKHGFQYQWYFNQGLYLTDTYWPKVLAESGWLGALFLILSFIYYPFKYIKNSNQLSFAGIFSFSSMTFMLLNSFSAPVYNSAIMTFMVLFIVGFDNKNTAIKATARSHDK